MRELTEREISEVSGGLAPLAPIGFGAAGGALWGGLSYAYDSNMNGSFTWSGLTGSIIQGTVTGALMGAGTVLMATPGGFVAGVSAEGLAGIITVTNPGLSVQ